MAASTWKPNEPNKPPRLRASAITNSYSFPGKMVPRPVARQRIELLPPLESLKSRPGRARCAARQKMPVSPRSFCRSHPAEFTTSQRRLAAKTPYGTTVFRKNTG
jgi:hypothetical protein